MAFGVHVYDPFIKEKIVDHQYFDFHQFVDSVDFIVIMVGHEQIREAWPMLREKVILDCRDIFSKEEVYKL